MNPTSKIKVRCPQCKTQVAWEGNPHRPFCSERCKLIDLGQWATEQYKVPCDEDENVEEDNEEVTKH
ncbi:MAG: DNA gyrase inhibitor YacG [Deltaproteobacteria bacterium]|nr:DNA gyrase inhibitor YacG [Deltaproteobacteria bacterium]